MNRSRPDSNHSWSAIWCRMDTTRTTTPFLHRIGIMRAIGFGAVIRQPDPMLTEVNRSVGAPVDDIFATVRRRVCPVHRPTQRLVMASRRRRNGIVTKGHRRGLRAKFNLTLLGAFDINIALRRWSHTAWFTTTPAGKCSTRPRS